MIFYYYYLNLDISKLSIDELKTFKKFNREFLPKIKKLDFNFLSKRRIIAHSTPKDIIKFIKKTPSTNIFIRLWLKKEKHNTCPVTFDISKIGNRIFIIETKYLKLEYPNFFLES